MSVRPLLSYHTLYGHAIHPDARFPRSRYWLVHEEIRRRGLDRRADVLESPAATRDELLLVHDAGYVDAFLAGELDARMIRRIGFRPWKPEFVPRTLAITGGTLAAIRRIGSGARFSANLAGGTHHAFVDRGEGYCVFNDLAIAVRVAQTEMGVERVLIIDLDVHQGNGTAAIFEADDNVFTYSMHGRRNYPFYKERSDFDLELEDDASDADVMAAIERTLPGIFLQHHPQLVIYQAGVDALREDALGRLAMTREGLAARNRRVFDLIDAYDVPALVTMGGGYADPIDASVQCHADVFEEMLRRG